MGCDIHMMAEVQDPTYRHGVGYVFNDDAQWQAIKEPVFPSSWFREDQPPSRYNRPFSVEPYSGRNYALFSLLANVRNTRTLHNMFDPSMEYEERDAITPIAEPRGVPTNASKRWLKEVKRWGEDLHSMSYFTLQELLDALEAGAFDQTIHQRGYVPLSRYLAHKREGADIQSWASYSSVTSMTEADWLALTDERREELIAENAGKDGFTEMCIRYAWEDSLREYVDSFITGTIEGLKANAPRTIVRNGIRREPDDITYHYDRIRIVFGFDN